MGLILWAGLLSVPEQHNVNDQAFIARFTSTREKLLEDDRNGRKASELNNLQTQAGGRKLGYGPSHHQIEV